VRFRRTYVLNKHRIVILININLYLCYELMKSTNRGYKAGKNKLISVTYTYLKLQNTF
jgi:hypothetical protein